MVNLSATRVVQSFPGAVVVGTAVAIIASIVLLPVLGQLAGSVAALGLGIAVGKALRR